MGGNNQNELICGVKPEKIRKAYFGHKMTELINSIQGDGDISAEDLEDLENFLKSLRASEKDLTARLIETFGGKLLGIDEDGKVPTTEQLYNKMTEDDRRTWEENVSKAKTQISVVRSRMANYADQHTSIKADDWADAAIVIESLKRWLAQEYIYKEQKFKKRICDIIDEFDCSRAEAQNRAEVTKEYSDYKNALKEYESVTELVLLYKKRAGIN